MFEKAVIRRAGDREIDLGTIAETLFFYGKTHLLLNKSVIRELTKLPRDDLLELCSPGCINLSYVQPIFGVYSSGIIRVHNFSAFEVGPKDKSKRKSTYQEEISDAFSDAYGTSRATRNAAKRFIDRVELFRNPNFNDKSNVVCELAKADIGDPRFVRAAVVASLHQIAPTYPIPSQFQFDIFDTGSGYAVASDIDFPAITKVSVAPFDQGITAAHLLGFVLDARADTFFAAHYMAELVTTDFASEIIKLKHYEWLRRSNASQGEIMRFTEVATDNFPSIREAIMSGGRTMTEFFKLLDQADKFRSWIQATNPDQGLLNAYFHEATKDSWADKLPSKTIRIAALTLAGLAIEALIPTGWAITSTTALSAGDSLLLDKIAKGWRPAHFITGPYMKFVDPIGR
jgi:hypothetical protein